MLPTLSRLSVSCRPGGRLRHRCSSRYLRISPLHREFRHPLRHSSTTVSDALPRLSRGLSHPTYNAAYTRFTPSNSEQRLHPLYYRGCWHRVSRCFLWVWSFRSCTLTAVYTPKGFILHAALPRHAFAHCGRFVTAASRRSPSSVSVSMRRAVLSHPLPVFALVSHYLTN